jgi:hypothetical protein
MVSTSVTPAQDIDITYLIKSEVPMFLLGDGSRLRQVLLNLISNAVKFTKVLSPPSLPSRIAQATETIVQYGEVSLDVSVRSKSPLVLKFDVNDTGIGISECEQERLFQPFSQADASITRQYGRFFWNSSFLVSPLLTSKTKAARDWAWPFASTWCGCLAAKCLCRADSVADPPSPSRPSSTWIRFASDSLLLAHWMWRKICQSSRAFESL